MKVEDVPEGSFFILTNPADRKKYGSKVFVPFEGNFFSFSAKGEGFGFCDESGSGFCFDGNSFPFYECEAQLVLIDKLKKISE